jgi:heptosyltransferase-2
LRDPARHDVERNLSVLQPFGIAPEDCGRVLRLPIRDTLRAPVENKLRELGYDPAQTAIGINPGSVWPMKRWSAEGFARVIDLACQTYGCQAILFGGPQDGEIASRIEKLCRSKLINSAGQLTLNELPVAIALCKVFVTNDSGPMHIAAACNVPTVAIFCATTPSLGFYPYTSNAIVVEKNLHCRPCSAHGGRRCPLGTEDCIRGIKAEHVFAAVKKLMGEERGAGLAPLNTHTPSFMSV